MGARRGQKTPLPSRCGIRDVGALRKTVKRQSTLLDELSLDFLLLIDAEQIHMDPEDRAVAPQGRALHPTIEPGGLNSEGGSGQWHVPNLCYVLLVLGREIKVREGLDIRARGCGHVDIDE